MRSVPPVSLAHWGGDIGPARGSNTELPDASSPAGLTCGVGTDCSRAANPAARIDTNNGVKLRAVARDSVSRSEDGLARPVVA